VLKDANLTGCNFCRANLRGAKFEGATLTKARFSGASNIPQVLCAGLDKDMVYQGQTVPTDANIGNNATDSDELKIFISRPSCYDGHGKTIAMQVIQGLRAAGAVPVEFARDEYGLGAPLDEIKKRIWDCDAVVIVGVPQIWTSRAIWRKGTNEERDLDRPTMATPWNHVEAGVAVALDKPILIVKDAVSEGVFDVGDQPHAVTILDLEDLDAMTGLSNDVEGWARTIVNT
jgi:hypothetical protein